MAFKFPALETLSYASGNIVDDRAEVLVNTVNCQLSPSGKPVMGAGVAKAFRDKWGDAVLEPYAAAIRSGELRPGRALLFDLPDGRKWAALATKDDWQSPSKMEWVESGLKELGDKLRAGGFSSVAIPPPGCGNGGLDWKKVEPLVHRNLKGLNVSMYGKPSGAMLRPEAEIDKEIKDRQLDRLGKTRDAEIKKHLYGKIVDEPDVSFDPSFTPGVSRVIVSMSVQENAGGKAIPVYFKSDEMSNEEANKAVADFARLKKGSDITLGGKWVKGKTGAWGFVAARVAEGRIPTAGLTTSSPSQAVLADPHMADLAAGLSDGSPAPEPVRNIEDARYPVNEKTPVVKEASMYFSFGWRGRQDVKSETTFDAILEGERTSTTRFDKWASSREWANIKKGDLVRFYEDREMKGRSVVVKVDSVRRIDMGSFSEKEIEDWSKAEGWSVLAAKEHVQKRDSGFQVRYIPVPGQKIIEGRGAEKLIEQRQREETDRDLSVLTGGKVSSRANTGLYAALMNAAQQGQGR